MSTELKAPEGKIRVVGVDLSDHVDYRVGDYDDHDYAFRVADEHNEKRRFTGRRLLRLRRPRTLRPRQ